jgi:cell division protein FtsQ
MAAGGWLAKAVLGSAALAVSHVVVRGNTRLSNSDVEALVDGIRGENILLVDFDHYRKRLMDSPWVAGVTLWRVLPSTVEVTVVERLPMAVARLGQQLYLVDRAGSFVDQPRVRLTATFLDAIQARPDLRRHVSQVDVSNAYDVVVLLDDDPASLHVGDSRFVERLQTYFELAPTLRAKLGDIDYVDLRFDERIYVRARGHATTLTPGKRRD